MMQAEAAVGLSVIAGAITDPPEPAKGVEPRGMVLLLSARA